MESTIRERRKQIYKPKIPFTEIAVKSDRFVLLIRQKNILPDENKTHSTRSSPNRLDADADDPESERGTKKGMNRRRGSELLLQCARLGGGATHRKHSICMYKYKNLIQDFGAFGEKNLIEQFLQPPAI